MRHSPYKVGPPILMSKGQGFYGAFDKKDVRQVSHIPSASQVSSCPSAKCACDATKSSAHGVAVDAGACAAAGVGDYPGQIHQ